MNNNSIRVRFAPSPTGPLHIGGVRTALYNYLFAKKHGGDFLLRIEDTDQTRYVPGAEEYIIESLKWCGISIDEGVTAGGEYGPYRQSERKALYKEFAEKLVKDGKAYYAFDTPEELDTMRERLKGKGVSNPQYDAKVRMEMQNSLTIDESNLQNKLDTLPFVIRFKMPDSEEVKITDKIRGDVVVNTSTLDDKILFKSDGMPTYHLANVVDDHLMKISHVIRGEEWLPSTPLHVLLYKAFGWEDTMPEFAHLPLLLKPNGNGKLSKRDGDQLGFPVFPLEWKSPDGDVSSGYRESGYFPEAFINMLALLGWNPGTEQELFSMAQLEKEFSLERVGKSGAKFDPEKAKWFNQQYLREKPDAKLAELFGEILKKKSVEADKGLVVKVVSLVKERVDFVHELWDQANFFFQAPESYDPRVIKKRWKENTSGALSEIASILENSDSFTSEATEEKVKQYIADNELNMGQIMNCFRLCLVGAGKGPHLFDIIEIIGKEETIARIKKAVEVIKK